MKQRSRFYPALKVDTSEVPAVSQAGGVLLSDTVAAAELDAALSAVLARWRKPLAVHGPGKVVTDLALSLALGGHPEPDLVRHRRPGL